MQMDFLVVGRGQFFTCLRQYLHRPKERILALFTIGQFAFD
jgi:hypothetical protein